MEARFGKGAKPRYVDRHEALLTAFALHAARQDRPVDLDALAGGGDG